MDHSNFSLFFKPWSRLAHAWSETLLFKCSYAWSETLLFKVFIDQDGMPAHVWDRYTTMSIHVPSCWIERLSQHTASRENLASFRLEVWTTDHNSIPKEVTLLVAELILGNLLVELSEKKVLAYRIFIHLAKVKDYRSFPSLDSQPPGDGGLDGSGGGRPNGGPSIGGPLSLLLLLRWPS